MKFTRSDPYHFDSQESIISNVPGREGMTGFGQALEESSVALKISLRCKESGVADSCTSSVVFFFNYESKTTHLQETGKI